MQPYAEDLNYWKTSKQSPGHFLEKASEFLIANGAEVRTTAKGTNNGQAAYLIEFAVDGDRFRIVWPVLESSAGNVKAAERQAATMLYYDVKSRAIRLAIGGARTAYFEFLMLPDGRTMGELASNAITDAARLLPSPQH